MTRPKLAAPLLALAMAACGSPPTPASAHQSELAQRARARRDHLGAARHYERAADAATKPREAEEARYRAAESYARGGDSARAEALYLRLEQDAGGERAARAAFELAELSSRRGNPAQARARRLAALRRHPSSGLAARALAVHLDELRREGGSEAVLAFLDGEGAVLAASELGETIAYRRARELTTLNQTRRARDAYLLCASRYPYPMGAYWDDALFRAAEAELSLGSAQRALAHLTRLLAEQESASVNGSYQRGRYAEAQLKIAIIYRDVLRDESRARAELRKVWLLHRTSRLVDDALFQEALLARQSGEADAACAPLTIIVTELQDSRYAPCAHLLCSKLAPVEGRACRDYIKREAGLGEDN